MAATGNPVIATAALGIVPVISGVQGNIASQLAGSQVMRGADKAGRSVGSRIGSTITSSVKTTLKVGGLIAGTIGALTIKGGINRALGIEDAQAKMRGLGHDTKTVDKIMANALSSVEGTSFGLDAAATTAAGAVAAGIKPGKQLEGVLATVANTAAATGGTMDEVGNIFNTVAAVGAAYTGDINMLAQRGIPIWQSLSETLGVSQDEVRKMATQGKIDFATFEAAAKDASGGVALAMGDTTRGALANMLTAFSKLGADLVTRFLPMVKTAALGIQATVKAVTKKVSPILDALFAGFSPAATAGISGFFDGLVAKIDAFDPQIVLRFFDRVKSFVSGLDFSSFTGFFESLGGLSLGGGGLGSAFAGIGGGLGQIASAAPGILSIGLQALGSALQFLSDHADTVVKLLPYIVAGFVAYKLATTGLTAAVTAQRAADIATLPVQLLRNATAIASAVTRNRATVAELRLSAAKRSAAVATTRVTLAERGRAIIQKAQLAWTKTVTAAQWLWNAAMSANPIGLIIAGVVLLVGALVLFFTKTKTGQQIWETVWGAIKNAAAVVADWFMNTALPMLKAAWDGIASGALWLYNSAILPAWSGIKTAIAVVGDWITGTLWPAIQTAWSAIGAAAMWLWTSVIQPVWTGIKIAIAIAVTAILVYIDLLKWYFQKVIAPVAMWLWNNVMKPVWSGIQTAIGAVIAWVRDTAWPMLKAAWDAIAGATQWLYRSVIKPIWNGIKTAISTVVGAIKTVLQGWVLIFQKVVAPVFQWLYRKVIQPVWNGIKVAIYAVVSWFQNTAWPILSKVINWIRSKFEQWKLGMSIIWSAIKTKIINPIIAWFRDTAWPTIKRVIDRLKSAFTVMRDKIKAVWQFVKDRAIKPVADWFKSTLEPSITGVTDKIKSAFDTMKNGIKKAWDGIKSAAKVPVRFVVEDVYRDTIKATFDKVATKFGLKKLPSAKVGFKSGGVMPGYTPGRDVHQFMSPTGGRLDLSGGEAIMRPEWTRAVGGPGAVAAMNASARKGMAFKNGGVFGKLKGLGGDALDWMKDKVSAIAEVVKDPLGALKKLGDKALGLVPGGGFMKAAPVAMMKHYVGKAGEWLKGNLGSSGGGAGGAAKGTGTGGSLTWASKIAQKHGLKFTSGYRPGARTSSGSLSMHGLGRARDFSNGVNTPQEMAFFNEVLANSKPTELLYTPAGSRNVHRGGRQYANTGALARMHHNHVHVAYKDGGVMPTLYDQGGKIPPGVQVVANKTRRPETILPPAESDALTTIAKQGGGSVTYINENHVTATSDKARELVDELMWQQRIQARNGRYARAGG